MSDRGHCIDCGRRTRNRDDRGFVCMHCAEGGDSHGEGKEAQEGRQEAEADVLTPFVGEFGGVRYEAGPEIPRGEVIFLCNKLGALVRGRVLKGELTLHFPKGPGR